MAKNEKSPFKKAENSVKIIGVRVNSTQLAEVLKKIRQSMAEGKKILIFTPNPEFLVFAKENPWFREILNSADISIPDGIGLVWASRILGKPLKGRLTGVDLAEKLLKLADKNCWQVGIVGARRGVVSQRRRQMEILRQKYPAAKIFALEDTPGWQKQKWEIIFACQGMGEQEKWAVENLPKIKAMVIIGAGGSLDFLTGFSRRAPVFIRKIGFEWFWRLVWEPWRARRQLALLKFIWLVILQKLHRLDFET